jgi:hypothetical protein
MRRTYLYRWRIHVDGPADTLHHLTFEDFRSEFPRDAADPKPIEQTERYSQEPESFEEEAEMLANYYWSLEPEDRTTVPADVIERYKLKTYPRPIRRATP